MGKVNLLISVDDEHLNRFSEVVESIKDVGVDIERQMEEIGVVTGSTESEKVELLSKVEGVSHIERSQQFQIAPPESDIQ